MIVNLGVKFAKYANGETLSDVLAYNHFGTETIPPRPVLRIAAENIIGKNKDRIKSFIADSIINPNDADRLEVVLLTSLGQQAAAEARRIIDAGGELQHNAPATVSHKGFDKPLYVDGTMAKNISYEVVK